VSSSVGTPLRPATSISTPRVKTVPTVSMPISVKPLRLLIEGTLTQL
jgi:hypothetical protein